MCNQATNTTPWVLLTDEQKEQFCREAKSGGLYDRYIFIEKGWEPSRPNSHFYDNEIYRLNIHPDKWYYTEYETSNSNIINVNLGKDLLETECYSTLRPAKLSEIPKPEKTLEELLEETYPNYEHYVQKGNYFCNVDTGEELVISSNRVNWRYVDRVSDEPNSLCAFSDEAGIDYIAVIVPKKTLEDRIDEEWSDYKVVMLDFDNEFADGLKMLCDIKSKCKVSHVLLQSMKGFYGYIYLQDDDLILTYKVTKRWRGKTIVPVAALLEVES